MGGFWGGKILLIANRFQKLTSDFIITIGEYRKPEKDVQVLHGSGVEKVRAHGGR